MSQLHPSLQSSPLLSDPLRASRERGVVLIYAMVGLLLVTGIVFAGSMREFSSEKSEVVEFSVEGHARQIAESGIVDSVAWLRQQQTQPVTEFTPRKDALANPPLNETDDAALGLVREFEIARGIRGRYVVRRTQPAEPFTDANKNGIFDPDEDFEDLDGNGTRTMARGAADISGLRGAPKAGTVWYLESEGSVYQRAEDAKPLGEGRNLRLAHTIISSEVRRLSVVLPAASAIVVPDGSKAKLEGTYVSSPILGVAYRPGGKALNYSDDPNDDHRVEFDAPTEHAGVPGWVTAGVGLPDPKLIRVEDVFGVSMETLRAMADFNIGALNELPGLAGGAADPIIEEVAGVLKKSMPYTFPENAFVVITPKSGEVVFDETSPLVGSGVVVVNGDLSIKPKTIAEFSGLLFVTGKMKVERCGVFTGAVIAGEKLEALGRMATVGVAKEPSVKVPSVKSPSLKSAKTKTTKTKTTKTKTTKTKTTKTKTTKTKTLKGEPEVVVLADDPDAVKVQKTVKTGKTIKSRRSIKNPSVKTKTTKVKTVKDKTVKLLKTLKKLKSIKSTPEESITFRHDPKLVERLISELGRYRRWKSSYRPVPVHEDGRPDEKFRTGKALRLGAHKAEAEQPLNEPK